MNDGMFTSSTPEYSTPADLFEELDKEFNFNLDPCCTDENTKCNNYFTKAEDGLKQVWDGSVFMNPPYGRDIIKWMAKAHDAVKVSKTAQVVVCLVPSRTDTKWWHTYAMVADEVRFLRGRLKFGDCNNSAPFPSAIVIFTSELFRSDDQ